MPEDIHNNMGLLLIGLLYCLIVAVHAQVVCRASSDCNGALGDDLGVMTIEQCCVDTPNGLGFSEGEVCFPCVVFGFFKGSFVGEERKQGHTIQVGCQKGAASAATNLVFNVMDIPGTARRGAGFDYTVSTTQVRVLFSRPTPPAEVLFIFRMDAIAQEENETLTLQLDPLPSITLPTGRNVFFRRTISLTIIDSDEVEVSFTNDEFRTNEGNTTNPDQPAFMPVVVTKDQLIAIVTGVVISAAIIFFVTAAMVTACVVLKKRGKKEQHQNSPQHTYESILLPTRGSPFGHGIQEETDRTTSIVDKTSEDETIQYDDLVSCQNVQKSCSDIHLRANEAYTSFNISA